jgi:oligopeptide transport system substrate-binding protein
MAPHEPNGFTRRELMLSAPLAALLLGSCGRKDAASTSAVLLRGNGPDPDSLDPHRARTTEAMMVLRDLFECLTRLDKNAGPAPGAAERWSVSDDGLVYTFHLRPDLKWSDGKRLVARHFAAGLRRLVNPETASQYAQVVDVIANAPDIIAGRKDVETLGVAAPDDRTLTIRVSAPAPYLPGLLAHPPGAPLNLDEGSTAGPGFARPGTQVSNGPFVLKEWLQGSYIRIERNPHYWNDAANRIDAVKYLQIADENAELRAYRAGELHCTYVVPRGQFDWIRENLGAELHVSPQLSVYYYGFNLDRKRFTPKIRQALSMAIDRDRLAQSVLRVGEVPAWGWVPPGIFNYTAQSFAYAGLPTAERIAAARGLLAEEGFTADKPLEFELRYNTGEVHNKVAVAVASMWKEALGVEAKLAAVEFRSLMSDIERREMDMYRLSWVGDYNDPYNFLQYLKSDFGINLPHYSSKAYDAQLLDAGRQTDPTRRRELLEAAERLMLADHPVIPLYFYVNKHLVKPELKGWYDNVMNVVYSNDLSLEPGPAAAART